MPLDYSKFDDIANEVDSDDEGPSSKATAGKKAQIFAQHEAMFLMVGWLAKANPSLSDVADRQQRRSPIANSRKLYRESETFPSRRLACS